MHLRSHHTPRILPLLLCSRCCTIVVSLTRSLFQFHDKARVRASVAIGVRTRYSVQTVKYIRQPNQAMILPVCGVLDRGYKNFLSECIYIYIYKFVYKYS